jgi:hypothetical protein
MTDPTPKPRCYRLTPDRLVIGLLIVECLLWLSERFQWFAFNAHKGSTVLIAVAAVAATILFMLPLGICIAKAGLRTGFSPPFQNLWPHAEFRSQSA